MIFTAWQTELDSDPDRTFLLTGIKEGFHIVDQTVNLKPVLQANYTSATSVDNRCKVEAQIKSEIREGHYIVENKRRPIVSALGAIPKPDGGIRLIHDGSMPPGHAMNDYASLDDCQYQSLQDALDLVKAGFFMAKVDLKSAYRSVKTHPSNHDATGLQWTFEGESQPTFMVDTRLPFGSRKAPAIFNRLTQSVRRMMARKGYQVVVYLDDFFLVGVTKEQCKQALNVLLVLLRKLGFQISYNKVVCPTTCLTFLGISVNTEKMTVFLPSDKLGDLQETLQKFSKRKRATRKQLQSLAGKLNWACQVIKGGRIFLRRIIDSMAQLKHASHKVLLSQDFKLDLNWWIRFLAIFNGLMPIRDKKPIVDVEVDACNKAAGMYFRGDWRYSPFRFDYPSACTWHINHKELLSVLLAAQRWGHLWANSRVIIHTDSMVAKAILNKGTTRNSAIMRVLRELFWLSVTHNFDLTAIHIPGKLNDRADAISRLHEAGQLLRLGSFFQHSLCAWHLPYHMSAHAFLALSPQIHKWQRLKQGWIRKLQLSAQPLLPPALGVSTRLTSNDT